MNNLLSRKLLSTTISAIVGLAIVSSLVPVQAEVKINLPDLGKGPGRRVPGGSRGVNCVAKNQNLTAIVPISNIGLTTVANPTLYFYIPENKAPEVELVVQDDNEQEVHKQKYKPNGNAGVVGVSLPDNTLAKGQKYRWNFSIICNTQDRSSDKLVQGTIQRVDNPQLMNKVDNASLPERLKLYADAGIWQDALNTLAQLRYSSPQDSALKADWVSLLTTEGVKLDTEVAEAPLVPETNLLQPINQTSEVTTP
ncbi:MULTISPECIES: DUF928 domain-containing protein [Nostocales]|uniref:DUF928 domain-containing protein n=1 Tax=Nostocales TaxID=1161 RepID=UPI001688650A|nr:MULTISPECIES: DUF928 domain-containing protein [Nostocales]MBD2297028.1 DUF928 domain-containing protein [Nostoc sp. FACHB-190]MBD2488040.1 DUF928 domain-containing protein [Aulosira sp. FACHB-615]